MIEQVAESISLSISQVEQIEITANRRLSSALKDQLNGSFVARSSKRGHSTIILNNDEKVGSAQKRKNLKLSIGTVEEGSLVNGLSQGKSMITRLLHDEANV